MGGSVANKSITRPIVLSLLLIFLLLSPAKTGLLLVGCSLKFIVGHVMLPGGGSANLWSMASGCTSRCGSRILPWLKNDFHYPNSWKLEDLESLGPWSNSQQIMTWDVLYITSSTQLNKTQKLSCDCLPVNIYNTLSGLSGNIGSILDTLHSSKRILSKLCW